MCRWRWRRPAPRSRYRSAAALSPQSLPTFDYFCQRERCPYAVVGTVTDATDIPTGYALVNGRKSVYLPVVKSASASTLSVVNAVKQNMSRFQAASVSASTMPSSDRLSPVVES